MFLKDVGRRTRSRCRLPQPLRISRYREGIFHFNQKTEAFESLRFLYPFMEIQFFYFVAQVFDFFLEIADLLSKPENDFNTLLVYPEGPVQVDDLPEFIEMPGLYLDIIL